VELPVGHMPADIRIVAFPDDRGLLAARREMAIQAGGGGVQRPVLEPLDRHVATETGVLDPCRWLDPGDAASRFLAPESVRVAGGTLVQRAILGLVHMRLGREFRAD